MKFLHIYIGMIGLLGYVSSPLVATERSLTTSSAAGRIVQKDKKPALKEKKLELRSSYIQRLVNNTDAYAFYRSNMYEKDRFLKKYIQDNPAIQYLIDAMLYVAVLQEYSDFSDSQKESIKKVFRKKTLQAYYARKKGEDVLGEQTRIFLINELISAVINELISAVIKDKSLNDITFSFLLTSDKRVEAINKEIMLLPNIDNEVIEEKIVIFFNMILKNSVPKKDQWYVFSQNNSDVPAIDPRWSEYFNGSKYFNKHIKDWKDFNGWVQEIYKDRSPISLIDSSFPEQITGVFINMQSAFNALKERDFKKAVDQIQRIDAFLKEVENAFNHQTSPESFFSKTEESQESRALTRQKDTVSVSDEPQGFDEPQENTLYKNDILLVQKMRAFFALILSSAQKTFFAMSIKDYQKIQSNIQEIITIEKIFDYEFSYLFYEYMAFVNNTVLPDLIRSLKKQSSTVLRVEQSSHEAFDIDNELLKFFNERLKLFGLRSMKEFGVFLDAILLNEFYDKNLNIKKAFYRAQEVFKMVQKRDFQSVATKIKELNGYLKNIELSLKDDKEFSLDVSFLQQVRGFFGLLLSKTQSYFSPMSLNDYKKVQTAIDSIVDSFSINKSNFNTVFSKLFYVYFKFLNWIVLPRLKHMQFGGAR